ncbi:MAG: indole-3-glycerol-phosphate synthase TrpC, partial [Myxococcales bacterium]|nr:indole-3-glycerol-phosphate synthase TrpC [Myxococcales bacterium]
MSHDVLADIVARKRVEIRRRQRHAESIEALLNPVPFDPDRGRRALEVLRRNGAPLPNVLAEIKFCSPSAGVIRSRTPGDVTRIARAYAAGGVAAISVLADGPGFGGSVLDVRRAASVVPCPVLFKEFVL